MATPIMMPKMGISVEVCVLTEWKKAVGDSVQKGDPLFTYETDKSVQEEASPVDGTLLAQFFNESDDVPVLQTVCVIGNSGEDFTAFAPVNSVSGHTTPSAASPEPSPTHTAAIHAPAVSSKGDAEHASPRAKQLAKKTGADLRYAHASGAYGRIISRDVEQLLSDGPLSTYAAAPVFKGESGSGAGGRFTVNDNPPVAPGTLPKAAIYSDEELSNIRKVIAKTMAASLAEIPQLTETIYIDASQILEFRKMLKQSDESLGYKNITLNAIVVFTVSRILQQPRHRALNAHLLGTTMRYFSGVHIGIPVDTERGLMVPTLFDAGQKTLLEIADEAKALASQCQEGSIHPDLLSGASFTVSNIGMFGIDSFTPIVNPPQTAILGLCAITPKVRETDGRIQVYQAMGLSLTYDHRAIDGAPASRFLVDIKKELEHFPLVLCK